MTYAKYDQNIIYMVSKSRNPKLFPELNIPRSTAKHWIRHSLHLKIKNRNIHLSENSLLQSAQTKTLQFKMKKLTQELKTIKSYVALLESKSLISAPTDPTTRFQIIQIIKNNRGRNSIRSILGSLRVSFSTYKRWAKIDPVDDNHHEYVQKTCRSLTIKEVQTLTHLYSEKSLFFYPLQALSTKAKKEQRLFASPRTWGGYIKKFKLKRPVKKRKQKKVYKIGIRAHSPHEIWHIDVTEFRINNEKFYMQAILDNYSRVILGSHFIKSICARNTVKLIKRTIHNYRAPLKIMSDAGKENLNYSVRNLLEDHQIRHSVAKLNTRYSNSKIEVFFRMLKSNYISHLKISSKRSLNRKIKFYIYNYNHEIPHASLNFRTPIEALTEVGPDYYPKLFMKYGRTALETRISEYKNDQH